MRISSNPARPLRGVATAVAAAVLLSTGAVVTTVVAPAQPAAADEVTTAQRRVDRLQALVASRTKQLTDGTRQWEADQTQLRRVQLRLQSTKRRVTQKQQVVDAATAHVNVLARRAFMWPVPSGVTSFLQTPDDALAHLEAQSAVDRIAGSDDQVIRDARVAKLALRREQQQVEQYAAEAQRISARSAARLAKLQALAADTNRQLVQAQGALVRARAARAAHLAALAAARAARAARAAKARRALVRTAPRAGSVRCGATSSAGQSNGFLDPAILAPLWGAPGHQLRCDAAAAFNRMSAYHAKTRGKPLCVTDSYRSYGAQVDVYRRKPGLAAVPGTSNHGWGLAVDFCGGIQTFGSAEHMWMKANAGRFGWFHPSWAEPSGSKPEAWHWEFRG